MLDAIVARIVASIAEEIETAECNRAILKVPNSLDAWEAYHRGLWHMYKFNGLDNRHAANFFRDALRLDPTFSRAYAGLSFTHFQNAFLGLAPDRTREIDLAFDAAGRSMEADSRDPAAHWAMGRALWLIRAPRSTRPMTRDGSRRSTRCSSRCSRAARSRTSGSGRSPRLRSGPSRRQGRPNAHVHILAIAVHSLVLAKRHDEAKKFVARIRARAPTYTIEDFLGAFRFDADTAKLLRQAGKQIGFDSSAR